MITLPSKPYTCPEGSSAVEILQQLGVVFGVNTDGEREVWLDPILMVAVLALQGKNYPAVSSLIELWKNEDSDDTEKGR